jgi:hypothetical protein
MRALYASPFSTCKDVTGNAPAWSAMERGSCAKRLPVIPFAIKNLLNEERCFGGGQPCGLAAA